MTAKRDVGLYLEDILESIKRIEQYTHNISEKEFSNNGDKQDAVVYRLEVIGEAIKNIPQAYRSNHPEVPWRDIAKTRDKIIHHYFEVDCEQVWTIIQNDLQPLKGTIQQMLTELDKR